MYLSISESPSKLSSTSHFPILIIILIISPVVASPNSLLSVVHRAISISAHHLAAAGMSLEDIFCLLHVATFNTPTRFNFGFYIFDTATATPLQQHDHQHQHKLLYIYFPCLNCSSVAFLWYGVYAVVVVVISPTSYAAFACWMLLKLANEWFMTIKGPYNRHTQQKDPFFLSLASLLDRYGDMAYVWQYEYNNISSHSHTVHISITRHIMRKGE